jgi:hypothetical protein
VPLRIGTAEIDRVSSFRYLGVIITDDESCADAVKTNCASGYEAWGRLRSAVAAKSKLGRSLKRGLISVIVLARVLYGCETWALDRHMEERLRAAQQRFLRIATHKLPKPDAEGTIRYPSRTEVLKAASAVDIVTELRRRRLAFACRVSGRPHEYSLAAESFHRELTEKRPDAVMRPDWVTQVIQDARIAGIDIASPGPSSAWRPIVESCTFGEPGTNATSSLSRDIDDGFETDAEGFL